MRKAVLFCFLLVAATGCKEKYMAAVRAGSSFLVAEGFINSGTGPTNITITKTTGLTDTASVVYVSGASVPVTGKSGSSFKLIPSSAGVYDR